MDKLRLFIAKGTVTLVCATGVFVYERSCETALAAALLLAVAFNPAVLFYLYVKRLEYRKRFLRRAYSPSRKVLIPAVLGEVASLTPFYYLAQHWKMLVANMGVQLVMDMLLLFGSSGRRTIQLERNEEFFKIGFLRTDHVEDGDVCLNKGEVVQILDHSGGNAVVRKSDGRVFTIGKACIDDGIDIVL